MNTPTQKAFYPKVVQTYSFGPDYEPSEAELFFMRMYQSKLEKEEIQIRKEKEEEQKRKLVATSNTKEWVLNLIEKDLVRYESTKPDIVRNAREFLKKIKCIFCLDTKFYLKPVDGWFYGIYYDEYTCHKCSESKTSIKVNRFYNYTDAFISTGRQIPCNTDDLRSHYSHALSLSKNYELEYADEIKLKENEKEKEIENEKLRTQKFSGHKFEKFMVEKKSVDLKVDFSGLYNDITNIITACAGNIAALPLFFKGVDVSLKLCWSKTSNNQNSSDFLKNDNGETIYIRLDYEMRTESKNVKVGILRFNGETKTEYLYVSVLVLKPVNEAAEEECRKIMREDFQRILEKLDSDKKPK